MTSNRRPILAALCFFSCAAHATAQTINGPFAEFNPWWTHPTQGTLGVSRTTTQINIDRDGDGITESSYPIPTVPPGVALNAPNLRLSPTREILFAFGNACNGSGMAVYFFDVPTPPGNLTLIDNACIDTGIANLGFYDTGLCTGQIGLSCFDGVGNPLLGVSPQRIAYVASIGSAFTSTFQVYWFDLVNGTHAVTFPPFSRSGPLTRYRVSPNGDAAIVQHDIDGDALSHYTLIDLCPERLGTPLSSATGGSLFNLPNPVATAEMIAIGPNNFVRVTHTSLSGGADDFAFTPCGAGGPAETGGCCRDNGDCSTESLEECNDLEGNWFGPGSDCTGCVVLGPCCLPTSCVPDTTQAQCTTLGGSWLGAAGDCNDCPVLELNVSAVADAPSVASGASLSYTISYGNSGDINATNVTITNVIPTGSAFVSATNGGDYNTSSRTITWTIGSLNTGANGTRSFTVRAPCGVSSMTNGTIQIRGNNVTFNGPPGAPTTVTPASTDPVNVLITSVPARVPLQRGDVITHTIQLTNTIASTRNGVTFNLNTGSNTTFSQTINAAGGVVQNFGSTVFWTGDLAPSAVANFVFTAVVSDCTFGDSVFFNGGTPVRVWNSCGALLGQGTPPAPIQIIRPMRSTMFALPPIGVPQFSAIGATATQLIRGDEVMDIQITLTNQLAGNQPSISMSVVIPAELNPVGDPPFITPTAPGATYDAATRTVSWNGPVAGNSDARITFRAAAAPGGACSIILDMEGQTGSCPDLDNRLTLVVVPVPPLEPHLVGIQGFGHLGQLWTFRPGIDTSRTTQFCLLGEIYTGMARTSDGDIWVTGLPMYRVNPATLDFEILPDDFEESVLGINNFPDDAAFDASDGSIVFLGESRVIRYDPQSGLATPIIDGFTATPQFFAGGNIVVDPDGRIAFVAYLPSLIDHRVIRVDPANPATFQQFNIPEMVSMGPIAIDTDGNYVVIEYTHGTASVRRVGKIDRSTGVSTLLVNNLNTLAPSDRPYFGFAVDDLGRLHLTPDFVAGLPPSVPVIVDRGPPPTAQATFGMGDAVDVEFVGISSPACLPCDTDCNGTVNPFDIQPFIAIVNTHVGCSPCAGDANDNGTTNQFDIPAFVECLIQ